MKNRYQPKQPQVLIGDLFDKQPPTAPGVERQLLASMMLDERAAGDVVAQIGTTGEAFSLPINGMIYESIARCYNNRKGVSLTIVANDLRAHGKFEEVGEEVMLDYLADLNPLDIVPSAAGALNYAAIVESKHSLRKVIEAAGQILHDAYTQENLGADEITSRASSRIFAACVKRKDENAEELSSILPRARDAMLDTSPGASGFTSGFRALDEILGGFRPGELSIIGARPSMGKTALATAIADRISQEAPVAFFSMEMGRQQIARRLLSANAHVSDRAKYRADDEIRKLYAATDMLATRRMIIDDKRGRTCSNLAITCRRLVERQGIKAIFIDYLQLMREPGFRERHEEVARMSGMLKNLAGELDIPVICLAQLNRQVTGRSDNKPRMSDLRESGGVEQDADIVALIHREEYYHKGDDAWAANNPDSIGRAEIIVDKNRNGATGVAFIKWMAQWTAFEEETIYNGE